MSLTLTLRGFRAIATMLACAGLALSPALAEAAPKTKSAAKKPAAATGLGNTLDLSPSMQLAAINTAIKAAPAFYTGRATGCKTTTAMLTSQPGSIMAGNFRDQSGSCYVWVNLEQSSMLTGSEICKVALHEFGHLTGLEHSSDPRDVMFAPFHSDPIPAPCQAQPAGTVAKAKKVTRRK
jgi:hypothetical protein